VELFEISRDSPSDPIARKPTDVQMEWLCGVAAAQERLVREFDLDALAYYYHAVLNCTGLLVNHFPSLTSSSLLTSQ
jgi:L-arabinose isomerase